MDASREEIKKKTQLKVENFRSISQGVYYVFGSLLYVIAFLGVVTTLAFSWENVVFYGSVIIGTIAAFWATGSALSYYLITVDPYEKALDYPDRVLRSSMSWLYILYRQYL